MSATVVKTERVKLDKLQPYPGNARRGNVEVIRESLRVNGQYKPIVVQKDTGYVLAGNHTLEAARAEGWTDLLVSWVECDADTARKINVIDNRSNDIASYDDEMLVELLNDLAGDYTGTGFDPLTHKQLMDDLMPGMSFGKDKDTPGAVPEETTTKPGDIFELGPHLLICGDALDDKTWDTLGPIEANLVVTDPPYMVEYDGWNNDGSPRRVGERATVPNDELTTEQADQFIYAAFCQINDHLKSGAAFYCFAPQGPDFARFLSAADAAKLQVRQNLVWVKDQFVFGRSDYHYRHEMLMYGWKGGAAHHALDDRTQSSVLEFDRPKRSKDHPTMKPVAMLQRLIENSSERGALVLDPFGGSGSTLVAAAAAGRRCVMIEYSPLYCDSIIDRWAKLTGEKKS